MTLPAARDLGVVGIRVVAVAPGGMAEDTAPWADYPEIRRQLDQTPWPKRFGLPEEFASLVMSIVGNDYLNGSLIRLDGGVRLPLK
jgi:NAD(P)-dependent dehydrogenase (short-subunit alcohol dehydrogenase family)